MSDHSHTNRSLRRVFSCSSCDHKMKFGAPTCGRCHIATPLYNRWISLFLLVIVTLFALFVAVTAPL